MTLTDLIEALQDVQGGSDSDGFQYHLQAALDSLAACGEDTHLGDGEEYAWSGPIVFEHEETGDHRIFEDGAIGWDEGTFPWAFRWQRTSGQGHGGAIPIGRVDRIERRDAGIVWGFGVVIPSLNDEAAEYVRLLEAEVAGGVSVDGDSAEFEVQENDGKNLISFSAMRLRSLTAVDVPAFNNARIKLDPRPGMVKPEVEGPEKSVRDHWDYADNLLSSAIPVKPSTAAFLDPKFDGPTAISIGVNGEVFGHLALWDTCHISYQGPCVKPPRNSTYRFFHTGELETEEGELVQIGRITFNTGHADVHVSPKVAAAHYDHTGSVAADVRAGEDEFGIWVVGALRPNLTDADIRTFRAAPLSGDWRRISGRLELVGALAVNTPGFPIPRARVLVASGETQTLFTYSEMDEQAVDKKAELAARLDVFADEEDAEVDVPSLEEAKAAAKTLSKAEMAAGLKDIRSLLDDPDEASAIEANRDKMEELYKFGIKHLAEASDDNEEFYNKNHGKGGRFAPSAGGSRVAGAGSSSDPLNQHAKTPKEAREKSRQAKSSGRKWAATAVVSLAIGAAAATAGLPALGAFAIGFGIGSIANATLRGSQSRRHEKQARKLEGSFGAFIEGESVTTFTDVSLEGDTEEFNLGRLQSAIDDLDDAIDELTVDTPQGSDALSNVRAARNAVKKTMVGYSGTRKIGVRYVTPPPSAPSSPPAPTMQIEIPEEDFGTLPPALAKKVVENLEKALAKEKDPAKKAEIQKKIDKFKV